ncbi:hypothetical protein BGW39_005677, partial [Mortierella sp. 14UC]
CQPSPALDLPVTFHPATVDLDALAEELAWPWDKPATSTYVMQPRPNVLEPL